MLAAFNKTRAKRGAVFSLQYQFPQDKSPRYKYCILMEDYNRNSRDLAVIFTTSHTEYAYKNTTVFVGDGGISGINGDTLIECDNWKLIQSNIIENSRTEYLSQISDEFNVRIENALTNVKNCPIKYNV